MFMSLCIYKHLAFRLTLGYELKTPKPCVKRLSLAVCEYVNVCEFFFITHPAYCLI